MNAALSYLFAGLIGGFGSSFGVGPINLWVADTALRRCNRTLISFLVGVILVDTIYATMAAWGYHTWATHGLLADIITIAGGAFICALGFVSLRTAPSGSKAPDRNEQRSNSFLGSFFLGAFLTASNPAFLMFWVFAINYLTYDWHLQMQLFSWVLFLAGIVVGDSIWFGTLVAIVRRGGNSLNPKSLQRTRHLFGWSFLAFGIWIVVDHLHEILLA